MNGDVDGLGEHAWLNCCGLVLRVQGEVGEEREVDDPSSGRDGGPRTVAAGLDDDWDFGFDGFVDLQSACVSVGKREKGQGTGGGTIFSTSSSVAGCKIAVGVCLLTSVQRDMESLNSVDSGFVKTCAPSDKTPPSCKAIACETPAFILTFFRSRSRRREEW